jgi:hypothetical protein
VILASIIVNGDSVPAQVMLTATLVSENSRSMTFAEARRVMADLGTTFDAEGEIAWGDDASVDAAVDRMTRDLNDAGAGYVPSPDELPKGRTSDFVVSLDDVR